MGRSRETERFRRRTRGLADQYNRWDMKVNTDRKDGTKTTRASFGCGFKEDLNGRASTFFFTNFPDSWDSKGFWKLFQSYGNVVDVYISVRRNKEGNRFGFVRFLGMIDLIRLEKELSEIWIGRCKLRVNLAKFHRRKSGSDRNKSPTEPPFPSNIGGGVMQGVSYAEVVKRGDTIGSQTACQDAIKLETISIQSSSQVKKILEGTLFGVCRSFGFLGRLKDCFKEEGWGDIRVELIGGLSVLAHFESKEEAETFLKVNRDVWSCWFKTLRAWDSTVRVVHRLVVITLRGLPSLFCNQTTCSSICKDWGIVQEEVADEWFPGSGRKWVIVTEIPVNLQKMAKVSIDGAEFIVCIEEDRLESISLMDRLNFHYPPSKDDDRSSSDFGWSEASDDRNGVDDRNSIGVTDGGSESPLPECNDDLEPLKDHVTSPGADRALNEAKKKKSKLEGEGSSRSESIQTRLGPKLNGDRPIPVSIDGPRIQLNVNVVGPKDNPLVSPNSVSSSSISHTPDQKKERKETIAITKKTTRKMKSIHSANLRRIKEGGDRAATVNLAGNVIGETFLQEKSNFGSSDSEEGIRRSNQRNWRTAMKADTVNAEADSLGSRQGRKETRRLMIWRVSLMMFKILSINLNGVRMEIKRRWVKELVGSNRACFLCIQETRTMLLDNKLITEMWGGSQFNFEVVEAIGRSGGICSVWDPILFEKSAIVSDTNFLAVMGLWRPKRVTCGFINVYAPTSSSARSELWSKLLNLLKANPHVSWIISGDFNEVRSPEERRGSTFDARGAKAFNEFIEKAKLEEPSLGGRKFTWSRVDGSKASKLDRFLVSRNFLSVWPLLNVVALPRVHSDHCPILLNADGEDFGPVPFKIFNSWIKIPSLVDTVEKAWEDFDGGSVDRSPIHNLCLKLKFLKGRIKEWRDLNYVKKSAEIHSLRVKLSDLDNLIDLRDLTEAEQKDRGEVLNKLKDFELMDLADLKQKAKIKWAVEGDENSKFFHGAIKTRKRLNRLHGLATNGTWESDPQMIKSRAFTFFKDKYKEARLVRPFFRSSHIRKIPEEIKSQLQEPFTSEEIKFAVWGVGSSKSPGPDGFSFGFIKHFWYILGEDFIAAVKHFGLSSTLKGGENDSFITLIPKVKDPLVLNDFRPIHLMGCVSKVISKVLAERLKRVIDKVISPEQTAFVRGRNILDGPLIVNEIISWAKHRCKSMFVLKVDFEKAFDNLNWDFLFDILRQMGFGMIWIGWIKGILTTAKVSILINNSPTKQFSLEKGVRQGDPLSPFLFIMAVEGLIAAMKEALDKNLFHGIALSNNGPIISNLHYADDAIFLGEWDEGNVKNLMHVLRWIHLASGLSINWGKSILYGIKVPLVEVTRVALLSGCKRGNTPFSYLGLPIGASMKREETWLPLIDKFRSKLSNWKANCLSMGGRFTLCKAVLGSLGVYYFSMFKAPSGVLKKLESLRRSFFWSSSNERKKIPWVDWEIILNNKSNGGLGIGSLKAHNLALLAKWWWRFKMEENALWRLVITTIHGEDGMLGRGNLITRNKSFWSSIASLDRFTDYANLSINSLFTRSIGNGSKMKFWSDIWCDDAALADRFPRLAALDNDRHCTIADRILETSRGKEFKWEWRRSLRGDREHSDLLVIRNLCERVKLVNEDGRWKWELEGDGHYSVSSLRRALDDMGLRRGGQVTKWNKIVPLKIRILRWRIMLDRIPTKTNLVTKGIAMDNMCCPLCNRGVETVSHLFINCEKVKEVRRVLNIWWKAFPIDGSGFESIIFPVAMSNSNSNSRTESVKDVVLHAYMGAIWQNRNQVVFNDDLFNPARIANDILANSYLWIRYRSNFGSGISWPDWCSCSFLV
ncbi:hypothetical protein OSB04_005519 [Centaurea solstitialis]|uniref:Uncharacterized protein n=1 Tax=Centaurea solstitialis TaxID=347529 RepID=A0AA38WRH3_9ASTR|nr:hypothetical protein OSB04_005519 [Centaurea solstitialis]